MLHQHRQHFNCIRSYDEFVMVGSDVFRDTTRVMKLAKVLFVETDRERLNAFTRFLGHQRHHGARIDASGKKRTKRNFRHQSHAHSIAQDLDRAFARFFFVDRELLSEVWLPVALNFDLAFAPAQPVSRFKFAYGSVSGQRRGNTHEREIVIKRLRFDLAAYFRMQQHRAELRREYQLAVDEGIKQWLFANAVAGEK